MRLGAALNVANSKPTVSINDMLPIDSGIELTVEEFIANALNKFECEHLLSIFLSKIISFYSHGALYSNG